MTKQLRGDALASRIRDVILELAAEAAEQGSRYVYNASKTAKRVPASRTTLQRYDHVVAATVQSIRAGRRTSSGEAIVEKLRADNARLQERQNELQREVLALRRHHIAIYRQFQLHSVDVALLIRPVIEQECIDAGHCTLCGASRSADESQESNVVPLKARNKLDGHEQSG